MSCLAIARAWLPRGMCVNWNEYLDSLRYGESQPGLHCGYQECGCPPVTLLVYRGKIVPRNLRLRDTRERAVRNVYLSSLTKNLWYEQRDSGGGLMAFLLVS